MLTSEIAVSRETLMQTAALKCQAQSGVIEVPVAAAPDQGTAGDPSNDGAEKPATATYRVSLRPGTTFPSLTLS